MLKNARQVEHGKQSSSEQSCAEGDVFKMDLHVQVSQNAVLEDQGRMIRDSAHTLRTEDQTESVIADLSKTGNFHRFSEESKNAIRKLGKMCHMRNMFKAFEGTEAQDNGSIRNLVKTKLHREKLDSE